ncbi:MAG TPA: 2-oxo acid dehydrogenase subunit E2 [Gemmatimonadaceae bacterium]|nr:2-oxo acid dehydrogenase subunit E2 [Gemmatimonadaceae bacterium]
MASLVDVTVPVGQAEGTESVVSTWFKAVGDEVAANEPLLEISTDKVNMEVAAPASGRLAEIVKNEGDSIEPGEVLGRLDTASLASQATAPVTAPPAAASQADGTEKPATSTDPSTELSPGVRRLIKEHNIDVSKIRGSGRGNRVTLEDVQNFIDSGAAAAVTAQFRAHPRQPPAGAGRSAVSGRQSAVSGRMVPHSHMRRSIANHMVQSVAAAPHVTSVFDADLSAVVADRDAHKNEFQERGVKLTYTAYFVRAAVAALKAVPEANSRWHDDALEIFDDANIGIATALGSGGLIVPVIMKAQDLDLFETAKRLQDLTERARTEKLDPKEVQNGTFTISNHGVSGSLIASPIIINQPQSAILGVGKLERRVVPAAVHGDDTTVKPMCYVTLTIDHRVLDGYQANQFLSAWVDALPKG